MITITARLSKSDFVKASLLLAYRKPTYIISTLLVLIVLIIDVTLSMLTRGGITPAIIPLVVILLVLPTLVAFSAVRLYRSNELYKDTFRYDFTADYFLITTSKSEGKLSLSALPKVVKAGGWLFVYQNTVSANVIPLRAFSGEQLQQLKSLLKENNVKNNL